MGDILLQNCKVVDIEKNTILEDALIAIKGEKIEWVGPQKEWQGEYREYEVLNMDSMYVLPGLWDMHVHLSYNGIKDHESNPCIAQDTLWAHRRSLTFLHHGVTTIRLPGTDHGIDFVLRDAIARRDFPGPRLLTAGKGIASTGGHGSTDGKGYDGVAGFRQAAREVLHKGVDLVKIMVTGGISGRHESYNGLQTLPDEVAAAIEIAHNWEKHVAGHVASPEAAIMCAEAGMDTIEHGYALNREALECMARHGTAYVPTLIVTHTPEFWEKIGTPGWAVQKIRQARENHHRAVELAIEMGLPICVGTDVPSAIMDDTLVTVREMEALQSMGATPQNILRGATEIPARICGLSQEVGKLKEGMMADIISTSENPLDTVAALREIEIVMTRGLFYRSPFQAQLAPGLVPNTLETFPGCS